MLFFAVSENRSKKLSFRQWKHEKERENIKLNWIKTSLKTTTQKSQFYTWFHVEDNVSNETSALCYLFCNSKFQLITSKQKFMGCEIRFLSICDAKRCAILNFSLFSLHLKCFFFRGFLSLLVWLKTLFYEVYYLQFQVSALYLFNILSHCWLNQRKNLNFSSKIVTSDNLLKDVSKIGFDWIPFVFLNCQNYVKEDLRHVRGSWMTTGSCL